MRAIQDFPDIDAGEPWPLIFDMGDFLTNSGRILSGTPTFTVTVAEVDDGATEDISPNTRATSASLGTALAPYGSGISNGAMQCIFTGVAGNRYLIKAECDTDLVGIKASIWAHIYARNPS